MHVPSLVTPDDLPSANARLSATIGNQFAAKPLGAWLFGGTAVPRAGLAVEVATHLTLAMTSSPWVTAAMLIVFSTHATVWGIIVTSIRQRIVPAHLLGRVASGHWPLELGGAATGSLRGGLLASTRGITTPFWVAAAVLTVIMIAAWRPLRDATP